MPVSVLDPVSDAIDHVGRLLFKPFDLKTWCVMGFCAFLANLGEGGGVGNSFRWVEDWDNPSLRSTFRNMSPLLVTGIVGGAVVVLAIAAVLLWLSSRGKFMFIDNVVAGVGRVSEPWAEYRAEGHALFVLRLALAVVALVAIGVPAVLFFLALGDGAGFTPALFGYISAIVVVVLVGLVVQWLINDFVVPVMFLRRCGVVEAWRRVAPTLAQHIGPVILYAVVKFLLVVALGAATFVLVLCTCCIVAIPYVGTVILLPLYVFLRSYALFFLGRLGPDYDRLRTMGPDVEHVAKTFE